MKKVFVMYAALLCAASLSAQEAGAPATHTSAPAATTPAPVPAAPATHTPTPAVAAPATHTPTPAVAAPATHTPTPAVAAPATHTPTPAVAAPATHTPTPAVAAPATHTPTPAVAAPATHTPTPAAAAQETHIPAPAHTAPTAAQQAEARQHDTAQAATAAAEPETPAPVPVVAKPAIPAPAPAAAAPAPEQPLTRADSALGVYKSARDSIIAANKKFPRPHKTGQAADTARTPREHHTALASAEEALRAAWAAMGVHKPPRQPDAQPDSAKTAAAPPRGPEAPESALMPPKPFKAQVSLGFLVPVNFGPEEPNFRPWWWNLGYYASYRDLDVDAQFSRGWGLDLSLYTFNKREYEKYYDSRDKENNIEDRSISDVSSMLIVDLAYHLKFYPVNQYKVPYISGSAGFCGAFFGGGKVSYKSYDKDKKPYTVKMEEDLVQDNYVLNAAVGVGVDVPLHEKLRLFAEVHYSLRVGLSSMFGEDGEFLGGLVPQIPIRFGLMMPFGL